MIDNEETDKLRSLKERKQTIQKIAKFLVHLQSEDFEKASDALHDLAYCLEYLEHPNEKDLKQLRSALPWR